MAGTDSERERLTGGPAIVLVRPQLGENIGTAARAMANFGLSDLRLVAPRDGWPSDYAIKAASGADWVLDGARVYDTTAEAIADLSLVYATTARARDMIMDVVGPQQAAETLAAKPDRGAGCGILYGGERAGLDNNDIALCDAILTYPVNPAFASLNLAQAVLLMAYEWQRAVGTASTRHAPTEHDEPASKAEMSGLFEHLEVELDRANFLKPPEKRPTMVRNLRNLFNRARLTPQEVRSLRGVIVALTGRAYKRPGKGEWPAMDERSGEDA